MFLVPGNLWESHRQESDPMHFVWLETYVLLLLVCAWWHGVALHLFSLLLAVTRNIYSSSERARRCCVVVCVSIKTEEEITNLSSVRKKKSFTDILSAFSGDVDLQTECHIWNRFWQRCEVPLRCGNFARGDDIKQLRTEVNGQHCVRYLVQQSFSNIWDGCIVGQANYDKKSCLPL